MKGDIIIIEEHHRKAGKLIASEISPIIMKRSGRYSITVAGESGSGKSETAQAIADELQTYELNSIVLGQDDYFYLPPRSNDAKRREDVDWLGPHVEVNFPALQQNIDGALLGSSKIEKPIIDYNDSVIGNEEIDISDIKVIIAEGTYTSLLKNIDTKVFIARNRIDTLEHRKKRNRGNEVHDPFIEDILKTEHKIIAGHIFLSDFIITKEYEVKQRGAYHH
ncbi:MAG: zeta toxin family protein [Desulfobacteraceae bacterium]|jgi:uridine kinase